MKALLLRSSQTTIYMLAGLGVYFLALSLGLINPLAVSFGPSL